eukprot:5628406-Ditylum_brightwellii.AAC.1
MLAEKDQPRAYSGCQIRYICWKWCHSPAFLSKGTVTTTTYEIYMNYASVTKRCHMIKQIDIIQINQVQKTTLKTNVVNGVALAATRNFQDT